MNHKRIKEIAKLAGAHYHPDILGKPNRIMFWEHEFDKFVTLLLVESTKFKNSQELYEYFEINPKEKS